MFREVARKKQSLETSQIINILNSEKRGVLSVHGENGYPYGVPMNFWYNEENGCIYFHSGKSGHKIDAIQRNEKASFCVIDQDQIVPEEYTTYFRSVIVFGRVRPIDDGEEMRHIATMLAMKYSPDFKDGIPKEINASIRNMAILELTIDHITAKEAIELAKQRNAADHSGKILFAE